MEYVVLFFMAALYGIFNFVYLPWMFEKEGGYD